MKKHTISLMTGISLTAAALALGNAGHKGNRVLL